MNRPDLEQYYKNKFHAAREIASQGDVEDNVCWNRSYERNYSLRELSALFEMAQHEVYPDGSFGDEEVNVWELFSRAFPGKVERE